MKMKAVGIKQLIFCYIAITQISAENASDNLQFDKNKIQINSTCNHKKSSGLTLAYGDILRVFCRQFHEYSSADNTAGLGWLKDPKKIACENLIKEQHIMYVQETADTVKAFADFCRDQGIKEDKPCVHIIDHFNQYCFNMSNFLEKVVTYVKQRSDMSNFLKNYEDYKILNDDWNTVANPVVKIEMCLHEFDDSAKYESNVKLITNFVNWNSKNSFQTNCSCYLVFTFQHFIESKIVESSNIDKIYEDLCTLNKEMATNLSKLTSDYTSAIFKDQYEKPVPVELKTLIFDILEIINAGWTPTTENFKEILNFIDYSRNNYEKRLKLVQTSVRYGLEIQQLKEFIKVFKELPTVTQDDDDLLDCKYNLLNKTLSWPENTENPASDSNELNMFRKDKTFFFHSLITMIKMFSNWTVSNYKDSTKDEDTTKINWDSKCTEFADSFAGNLTPSLGNSRWDVEHAQRLIDIGAKKKTYLSTMSCLTMLQQIDVSLRKYRIGTGKNGDDGVNLNEDILTNVYHKSIAELNIRLFKDSATNNENFCKSVEVNDENAIKDLVYSYFKTEISDIIPKESVEDVNIIYIFSTIARVHQQKNSAIKKIVPVL